MFYRISVLINIVDHHGYGCVQCHLAFVVGDFGFFRTIENGTFALVALAQLGDIVQTKHHVLRRHGDRSAIGRVKNIVGTEHQHLSLENRLVAERKVHSHLVAVEVGIERRTCKRMKLNGLAFDHFGLESLNTETVKSRGTVEEHRMSFHHIFQNVPYHRFLAVDNLFGALDSLYNTTLNELADYKRLVKFRRHILGNTAFMHFQFRSDNDYRTSRVIDTLTEKVLTEATLLALERVGE